MNTVAASAYVESIVYYETLIYIGGCFKWIASCNVPWSEMSMSRYRLLFLYKDKILPVGHQVT
jgi:hypothetical protein